MFAWTWETKMTTSPSVETSTFGGPPLADLTVTADLDLRAASAFISDAVTDGDAFLIANILGPGE